MQRILLVDDDVELCELLSELLTLEAFEVEAVHDGVSAAEKIRQQHFDLMVLDVMLPGKNGFDVLRDVSANKRTPVLMLTARGDEVDRILGLEMGADDYLAKPCNPRELVARIRSIIRRSLLLPPEFQEGDQRLEIRKGDLTLNPKKRQLLKAGQPIELTATEFEILHLLLKNSGELVTRTTISEQCLGRRLMPFDRSIDMHISHLRRKLNTGSEEGTDEGEKERIKTVRGVGYQYVAI